MAHVAHFLLETRLMVDFQIGNGRYGGLFRYLGPPGGFPYADFALGRDLDFPYTALFGSFEGGDVT